MMGELAVLMRLQWECWKCSLMHFTETGLNNFTPDSLTDFILWCNPGYIPVKEQ